MGKHYYFVPLLLVAAFSLTACGSDGSDGGETSGGSGNSNRNSLVQTTAAGRMEFPKTRDDGRSIVVVHSTDAYGVNYAVEWDCDRKAQRWTCYAMYESNSVTRWNRNNWKDTEWRGDPFQEDLTIPAAYRTTLADYRGSGFQRGHICPSADRLCSKDANEQTFYLSNMHPQYGAFNTNLWEKMEEQVRKWNRSSFRDTLYVCKGGTIEDYGDTEGVSMYTKSGLIVPKYFFMAVLCKKGSVYKAIGFWAEHENVDRGGDNLRDYVVSVGDLEKKTGIDFFCNLPDDKERYVQNMSSDNIVRAWGL